jgi:hypothetical protein
MTTVSLKSNDPHNEVVLAAEEVCASLSPIHMRACRGSAPLVRAQILQRLEQLGWSSACRIDHQHMLRIGGIKDGTGTCVQTGNVARVYADLLKLESSFRQQQIEAALYFVPTRHLGRVLGQNLAYYERVAQELRSYDRIITIPMVLVGFDLEEGT